MNQSRKNKLSQLARSLAFKTQYDLDFQEEINVDLFAGGGGASTGFEVGTNRPVDIAINHDEDAISMHKANHPGTEHFISDVYEVDPVKVCEGRRVGHLHASPDCTHHSQAAGGQPRKKAIRSLAWVVHKWAGTVRPWVITLENVEQMLQWSPLVAKRCKKTGRVVTLETINCPITGRKINRVAEPGERVPVSNQYLIPCKKRRGQNWRHFVGGLRAMGYRVQWRTMRACDYGDPTSRTRLYLQARCDGLPITWPKPTHAEHPKAGQKKWRVAADIIDWSNPGRSIFDRPRPLADNTLRRIAKGIKKFVLGNGDPFIVPIANYGSGDSVQSIREPLRTITAWPRGGSFSVVEPELVQVGYMAQMNGGYNTTPGHDLRKPLTTITNTGSQQQLVTAFLTRYFGTATGQSVDQPLPTTMAGGGGGKSALVECTLSPEQEAGALRVAAFLMHYYSTGGQWGDLKKPLGTITTKDRLALVTVFIKGNAHVITDIRIRMLKPRELYNGQGFPPTYIIDRGHDGRKFTQSQQVRFVGNSCCPHQMAALHREIHNPMKQLEATA